MTSRELVIKTMKGENPGRTPIYGWVLFELEKQIREAFGSVADFEDRYEFEGFTYASGTRNKTLSHVTDGITSLNIRKTANALTPANTIFKIFFANSRSI